MFRRVLSSFSPMRKPAGGVVLASFGVTTFFNMWHKNHPTHVTPEYVKEQKKAHSEYPIDPVNRLSMAPNVPPPIERSHPARVVIDMTSETGMAPLGLGEQYEFWTFNKGCPGPMIRCRVGDILEIHYKNNDKDGVAHNIDFHGVTGPGGGAALTLAEKDEVKIVEFEMLHSGLFVYHCAAAPVPLHVMSGMYGLLLVEPEKPLPKVDKEFYIMQSEFYTRPAQGSKTVVETSYEDGLAENPSHVVFNGREGALTDKPLLTEQGDSVRLYVGNAGPNLVSSFHIIGLIFDKVYREGDLVSPPARSLQTTLIPSGGASVIDVITHVPGNYTIVDHSIFRLEKGAVGFLKVSGEPRPDVYDGKDRPNPCPGCKLHN